METNLYEYNIEQLKELVKKLGEKPFRANQLAHWLYEVHVTDFSEMTNLSKEFRDKLSSFYTLNLPKVYDFQEDWEDETRKVVWQLEDDNYIESVLIKRDKHLTICLSSQVGCALACSFCCTGEFGFSRNLKQSEILGQVIGLKRLLKEGETISNIVFMGMGEPLLNSEVVINCLHLLIEAKLFNFSLRKISISTVGIIPGIEDLYTKGPKIGLTISLSAATDELRNKLMPINKKYPLKELKNSLIEFLKFNPKRLTIAYIMLNGVNDSLKDAQNLSRFLTGLKVKINLIPFNPWEGCGYKETDEAKMLEFQSFLMKKKYVTIIRKSKGRNLAAACGQLAANKLNKVI